MRNIEQRKWKMRLTAAGLHIRDLYRALQNKAQKQISRMQGKMRESELR